MIRFISALLILFTLFSCNKTETVKKTNNAVKVSNMGHEGHNHAPVSKHVKSSADSPYIGMWECTFALGGSTKNIFTEYKGRWFDLKADNTFESGWWGEKNNEGNWKFDKETNFITFEFENPASGIPFQWKVQGTGGDLIWKGNTPNNKTGIQIKWVMTNERPKKK